LRASLLRGEFDLFAVDTSVAHSALLMRNIYLENLTILLDVRISHQNL